MNIKQKLGLVGVSLFLVLGAIFIGVPKKAAAYVIDESQIRGAAYKFKDRATITVHFPAFRTQPAQDVDFNDSNAKDETYLYKSTDPNWCGEGTNGGIGFGKHGAADISWSNPRALKQAKAYIDIDYSPGATGKDCKDVTNHLNTVTNADVLYNYFQWNGNSLGPATDLPSNNEQFTPNQVDNNILQSDSGCASYIKLSGDNSGTLFELTGTRIPGPRGGTPRPDAHTYLPSIFKKTGDCYVEKINFSGDISNFGGLASKHFGISGTRGTAPPPGGGGGGGTEDTSDCVANSHTSLEWLLCPITTTISKSVDGMNKLIDSQLSFDVKGNLDDKGGVHTAWGIIKNLGTAILVIIMLIMVISQAVGNGVFEAYTVRKVLPRLVIAAILMQISWELCKWLITLANDAGEGIGQLLAAPFGGPGNLDLNSILHRLDPSWALKSQVIIPGILLGGAVLTAVALPGAFVAAFGLFLGALMALAILIFRNVLIIGLVIFSSVAVLLWTLPGQGMQKYWKFWSDNFTKLLILFPLIFAIIYSGRIFAWISADTGKPNFINYMIILVAYFGPYFIIFKAYNWGGGMLSAAGTAMSKAKGGIVKSASPILTRQGERAQGWLADRYTLGTPQQRELRNQLERTEARIKARKDLGKRTDRLEDYKKAQQQQYDQAEKHSRLTRAVLKTAAGFPLPTERAQIETLAKAAGYKEDLVKKKEGLMHNDYNEELARNGGNVQDAKAYILKKYGARAWGTNRKGAINTDRYGDPKQVKDRYTERAMQNWFIDTKSAMELGNEEWRRGAIYDDSKKLAKSEFMAGGSHAHLNPGNDEVKAEKLSEKSAIVGYWSDPTISREDILHGKTPNFDMAKTTGFMTMMHADPNRYAYVAEKLPTLQPFHQELGGGPKRDQYLAAVLDTDGTVIRRAGRQASPDLEAVRVSDYIDGQYASMNRETAPELRLQRAHTLAMEESERRGVLGADDARYLKWQRNMESPTQYATARPEEYQTMDSIKRQLKEFGVESVSAQELHNKIEELSESRGVEGISIIQRLTGGEKSARGALNSMFGTEYLESKLRIPSKNPVIKEAETERTIGRITGLPREVQLSDVPTKIEFKKELLNDIGRQGNHRTGVVDEFIQTIAEPPEYAETAHGTPKKLYLDTLTELANSVGTSQADTQAFNQILQGIIDQLDRNVQRTVKQVAADQRLSEAQRRTIAAGARVAADNEIARYRAMEKAVPPDDPGLLVVPHEPTIITPGGPGYTPPSSSDLPR